MKTIRMPKKYLTRWLAALRGGEYEQASRTLYDPRTRGFCCLGVLQHVVSRGYIELSEDDPNAFRELPSIKWLRGKGIAFSLEGGGEAEQPYLPTRNCSAASANDLGVSFAAIADAIEACAEGY